MPIKEWQKPNQKKYDKIVECRKTGLSWREIAKVFDMNHSRIRKIYLREMIKKDMEKK